MITGNSVADTIIIVFSVIGILFAAISLAIGIKSIFKNDNKRR